MEGAERLTFGRRDMSAHHFDLTPAERLTLERVRAQQGLRTVQDAAEWLVKVGLRRMMGGTTGRRRTLHLIEGGKRR